MSISSISTIAVARNSGAPTKADSSEAAADAPDAEEAATLPALLVKTVPTSLVAGYTAFIAPRDNYAGDAHGDEPASRSIPTITVGCRDHAGRCVGNWHVL
jgi:hypothetical protein